jgi:hypothetical protein
MQKSNPILLQGLELVIEGRSPSRRAQQQLLHSDTSGEKATSTCCRPRRYLDIRQPAA